MVEMLIDGGFVERHETPADAYLRVAGARYRLLRTHEWSDEVLARVRGDVPPPAADPHAAAPAPDPLSAFRFPRRSW